MPAMGLISRGIDKLPSWAQFILIVAGVVASVYCIAREGFFIFLLRMIFSPEI